MGAEIFLYFPVIIDGHLFLGQTLRCSFPFVTRFSLGKMPYLRHSPNFAILLPIKKQDRENHQKLFLNSLRCLMLEATFFRWMEKGCMNGEPLFIIWLISIIPSLDQWWPSLNQWNGGRLWISRDRTFTMHITQLTLSKQTSRHLPSFLPVPWVNISKFNLFH